MAGTSGTYNFELDNSQIVNEAFARCNVHSTALTRSHFFQATRSLNLALQSWSNKGVNLFQVDLIGINMVAGVSNYTLPSNTVNILDAYIETYSLQTTISGAPNYSTLATSETVTVNLVQHGLVENNWINIVIPVSIGGIVIQGLYQVQTVVNVNQFTIEAVNVATGTVNNGGVLPVFTTVAGSQSVNVYLPNHGLLAGNNFTVQEATDCGGLLLAGIYLVNAVVDVNNFNFIFAVTALANDTETENGGNQVLQTQFNSGDPIDRIMTSISRSDYAAYPDKNLQGFPTTFWYDRTSPVSSVNVWLVPNGYEPMTMFVYRMRRIQDAAITGGQTADIPYLFMDALCAELAARLARKFAPALLPSLQADAQAAWNDAISENRERIEFFVVPDTSGYFR